MADSMTNEKGRRTLKQASELPQVLIEKNFKGRKCLESFDCNDSSRFGRDISTREISGLFLPGYLVGFP